MTSDTGDAGPLAHYASTLVAGSRPDEALDACRELRDHWHGVGRVVSELGAAGLADRQQAIIRLLEDDGATYRPPGSDTDQRWRLDPVPFLVDESDWASLEAGLIQRSELLDAILTDLYGARRLIKDRLLPPEVVFAHPGFVRAADQIRLAGPRQLVLSSADLARHADGSWRVIADRAQAPSGAGYAMENRSVLSRALPRLYRGTGIHRIAPFYRTVRAALQSLGTDTGRVILLSPGPESETAFDQAFLSSLLGLPLAVAADLTVRNGRVWQRSLHRLEPVDVIVRRVDGWYSDPLDLRPDSQLGVPGLLEVARRGAVAIVNGVGSGVVENPGLFPFLPRICQDVLGEPLRTPSAETYWCGDPASLNHVLGALDSLVIKPIGRRVGPSSRLGWLLSAEERERLRAMIQSEPYAWIGQEPLATSTAPTLIGSNLDARSVVLRTFGVATDGTYQLMPGGLTRTASRNDTVVVSGTHGAISKDVWVLSAGEGSAESQLPGLFGPETVSAAVSPRIAEDLYWLGRYAERAESTTRLLRVVDNRWRDLHPAPDAALARCLVTLLQTLTVVTDTGPGFVGEGSPGRLADPEPELRALIGDERHRGSLAHDLVRVRTLANAVRDQLSNDTWAVLSGLERSLSRFTGQAGRLDETSAGLAQLLQALLAFSGLVVESMVRDAGWYLLDAGRRVERAQQLTALLRSSLAEVGPAQAEALVLESVLIAAESIITHRRRYPARGGVASVMELLLLDAGNPRALAYQLAALETDLANTDDDSSSAPISAVAGIRALLAEIDPAELAATDGSARPRLTTLLDEVGDRLAALHDLIDTAYFTRPGELQQLDPEPSWDLA